MNKSKDWEFILLYPKQTADIDTVESPLGVMFCYKNRNKIYVPSLVGLDYNFNEKHQTYRQLLYQTILAATTQNFETIDFGISANFEKKKIGATIIPMYAYLQADDNYALERLETIR